MLLLLIARSPSLPSYSGFVDDGDVRPSFDDGQVEYGNNNGDLDEMRPPPPIFR